jgi:ubiquinone biosynthesis protein
MARPARRIREIAGILITYGFRDWLASIHLRPARWRRRTAQVQGQTRPERIRLAVEEMGTTFIKFGQLLSIRKDVIPQEYIAELSKLQDAVKPMPSITAREIVERELPEGAELLDFIDEPEASASIAQVHRASISGSGEVAVKVQRPGIAEVIDEDMEILQWIALQVEHYIPALRPLQPVSLVKEFAKSLRRELNFHYEAQNMQRFHRNFSSNRSISIPRVYPEYSSDRVLVMQYMEGRKLSGLLRDPASLGSTERGRIAKEGARAIIDQVFVHAFFHADPHPGNILILPDGRICFLDFGIMGQISPTELEKIHQAIISIASNDYERLVEIVLSLVGRQGPVDLDGFRSDLFEIIDQYINLPIDSIEIPRVFQEILAIISAHNLVVPSKYLLMNKAIITIEGVAQQLQPGFTISSIMGVTVRRVIQQQFNPKRAQRAFVEVSADYSSLVKDFPRETREILRQLRRGRLGIEFKIEGIEPMRKTIDEVGSRVIYGLLLTAVMVSSALIFSSGLPPLWQGMPVVGLAGFGIAALMAGYYVINLIRQYFRNRWK